LKIINSDYIKVLGNSHPELLNLIGEVEETLKENCESSTIREIKYDGNKSG